MARRTFTIELKVDLGDESERYEPMKEIVTNYAQQLLATSILLAEGHRAPSVVVFTEDAYFTTEKIEIKLDDEAEEAAERVADEVVAEDE